MTDVLPTDRTAAAVDEFHPKLTGPRTAHRHRGPGPAADPAHQDLGDAGATAGSVVGRASLIGTTLTPMRRRQMIFTWAASWSIDST